MCCNIGIFWRWPKSAKSEHILDVFSGQDDRIFTVTKRPNWIFFLFFLHCINEQLIIGFKKIIYRNKTYHQDHIILAYQSLLPVLTCVAKKNSLFEILFSLLKRHWNMNVLVYTPHRYVGIAGGRDKHF